MVVRTTMSSIIVLLLFATQTSATEYDFETLRFPGAKGTFANGINNKGVVVGHFNKAFGEGFIWQAGEFRTPEIDVERRTFRAINDDSVIAVTEVDFRQQISISGFILSGGDLAKIEGPRGSELGANGINNNGDVVGWFESEEGLTTPPRMFVRRENVFEELSFPDFVGGIASDINDAGQIVGHVYDSEDARSGFILDGEQFSVFNHPDGETQLFGINNSGMLVGQTIDGGISRSFVFDGVEFQDVMFPGAQDTRVSGINDSGVLVGHYTSVTGSRLGFIARPVPEPSSAVLLAAAATVLGIAARRQRVGLRIRNPFEHIPEPTAVTWLSAGMLCAVMGGRQWWLRRKSC